MPAHAAAPITHGTASVQRNQLRMNIINNIADHLLLFLKASCPLHLLLRPIHSLAATGWPPPWPCPRCR
jgi:hypothetical protein